jgi:hypothetical protein
VRPLKIFGAAAVAALALAVAGIGSASAVTLCEVQEAKETCPIGKRYIAREYLALLWGEATFAIFQGETEVNQMKCTQSGVIGKTTLESGSPLPGEVTTFTLGGCTICKKAEAKNLKYSFNITSTGGNNGQMTITSGGSGAPLIKFSECSAFGTFCEFGPIEGKLQLGITGGIPAIVTAAAAEFAYAGGSGEAVCGKRVKMSANYKITEPPELFVAKFP